MNYQTLGWRVLAGVTTFLFLSGGGFAEQILSNLS